MIEAAPLDGCKKHGFKRGIAPDPFYGAKFGAVTKHQKVEDWQLGFKYPVDMSMLTPWALQQDRDCNGITSTWEYSS